ARYASEDVDVCLRLANLFEDQLKQTPAVMKLASDLEMPLISVLAEMEFNGIAIDPDILKEQSKVLGARIDELKGKILEAAGTDPNLQNIPIRTDEGRRIRLAFVPGDPEKNVLLTADYSQIELRMLAHFTQEPALMRAFEADEDVHATVASEVFNVPLDKVTKEQRG